MENNMITISQEEYKKLIKFQARLDIAQEYLDTMKYATVGELIMILGLKKNKKKEDDTNGNIV